MAQRQVLGHAVMAGQDQSGGENQQYPVEWMGGGVQGRTLDKGRTEGTESSLSVMLDKHQAQKHPHAIAANATNPLAL
ncbi:hypothetical protein ACFSHR_11080 [Azotobacter chroococcum]